MTTTNTNLKQFHLSIEGMKCAGCVSKVEKALAEIAGVYEARVNLASKEAWLEAEEGLAPQVIEKKIVGLGFKAIPITGERPSKKPKALRERNQFLISLLLTMPIMTISMSKIDFSGRGWFLFLATAVVVFVLGASFFRNAFKRALHFSSDMDTLISLGTLSAFLYSAYLLFSGGKHLYFESAAMIVTLILMGRFLETRALGRSGDALEKLLARGPKKALLIEGGTEREIPADHIRKGDLLMVRPGEKIPIDGVVEDGEGYIDESMFSGESVPLSKKVGDFVLAGTLSQDGAFKIRASGNSSESYFAQIIKIVQKAQSSKPPVQRLADRIAAVFVPTILAVALLTFLLHLFLAGATGSEALIPAICVLLIACPCTLGLATPVAVVVAMGRAAQHGMVIRDATYLESLSKVDLIAFDKTGTLTEGKPQLTEILSSSPSDSKEEILLLAASLEQKSEHPLGRAIVDASEGKTLREVENFQYFPGKGVSGRIEGTAYFLGQENFLQERGVESMKLENQEELRQKGNTLLFLAKEKALLAILSLADGPKATSHQALSSLQNLGIRIVMLTGDNPQTARAVGKKIGLSPDQIFAGFLPHEKLEKLEELKKDHHIAMVGDGINDAPSLSAAHVGIGLASGTEVAMESAGIVLASADLMDVVRVVSLSKKTMKTIRENLFFAFIYNILAIPFAALGFLSPMIAAGAMAMSSVSVVTNSNRLRKWSGG